MAAPRQLGPFRVIRKLSSGGSGAVYEAEHAETGGRYAVKVLLGDLVGDLDEDDRERFAREITALGKLRHPHVVGVHSADASGSTPYLVQDLLSGGTLQERIQRGPLPETEAVDLCLKLADGVAAAHAQGVLHRDLKPENVMFDDRGEPRLVDFGLALSPQKSADRLTKTGALLGTPTTMAPEQARADRTEDERTDVYGLGGLLYAMLTGDPPIAPQASVLEVLAKVAEGDVRPPRELRPDLSPALERVCLRALAAEPEDRYPGALAFLEALESTRDTEAPPALTPVRALAGAVALGGVGLLLALALRPPSSSAPAPRPPISGTQTDGPGQAPESRSWSEVAEQALEAGDASAALAAAEAGEGEGQAGDWKRVRGLAAALAGDLDRARALLSDDRDLLVVDVEAERLHLRARLDELSTRLSRRSAPRFASLMESGQLLLQQARPLRRLQAGAVFCARVQETLACLVLEMDEQLYKERRRDVLKLIAEIRALHPGPANLGAEVARVVQEIDLGNDTSEGWQELMQSLDALLAAPDLPPRWRATVWIQGVDRERRVSTLFELKEVPPRRAVEELTHAELGIYQSAFKGLGRRWTERLGPAYEARDADALVHAYRQALGFYELHQQHNTNRGTTPRESAALYMAGFHLCSGQLEDAERELARQFALRYEHKLTYLRLELQLAQGADLEDGFAHLRRRIERRGDDVHDDCLALQGAYALRLGDEEAAAQSFARMGSGRFVAALPWRLSEAETRADERGAGFRPFLQAALAD